MSNQIYNPLTYHQTQPSPFGFVDAVSSGKRDFLAEQGNMQSLQAMMTGNKQAEAELGRFNQMTPHMVNQQAFLGDLSAAKRNPGYIQSVLGGDMADHSLKGTQAEIARGTKGSQIGMTNTQNQNATMQGVAQFLSMVAAQNDPETADQVYQTFRKGLDPQMAAGMPVRYDPKTFEGFMNAAVNTPEHRRNTGIESQRIRGRHDEAHITGQYAQGREELQQLGANQRTEAEIAGRQNVAEVQARAAGDRAASAETTNKAIARLKKHLAANPQDQEAMDEYRTYVEDRWNSRLEKDDALALLRLRALQAKDPAVRKQARDSYVQERNQFFEENGFFLNAPPAGEQRQFPDGSIRRFKGGFGVDPRKEQNWLK